MLRTDHVSCGGAWKGFVLKEERSLVSCSEFFEAYRLLMLPTHEKLIDQ